MWYESIDSGSSPIRVPIKSQIELDPPLLICDILAHPNNFMSRLHSQMNKLEAESQKINVKRI